MHESVLVDGIPPLIKLVSDFFNRKEPTESIDPDKLSRAGHYPGHLHRGDTSEYTLRPLSSMSPLLLSTPRRPAALWTPLIKLNTTVPTKNLRVFSTYAANQDYEGERAHTTNTPSAPCGVPQIKGTFDIDTSSVLNVSAPNKSTGESTGLTIVVWSVEGRDQQKYNAEDQEVAVRVQTKNNLSVYVHNLCNTLDDEKLEDKFDKAYKVKLEAASMNEAILWLDALQETSKDECGTKQKELELKGVMNSIMQKMYVQAGGGAPTAKGGIEWMVFGAEKYEV